MSKLDQMRAAFVAGNVTTIDVPELGGAVKIRKLSARDAMALGAATGEAEEAIGTQAEDVAFGMICLAIVDDDGTPFLNNDEGRAFVAEWPPNVLTTVSSAVMAHNGISEKN